MASNEDLKKDILAIDANAQVDGLNNAQRADLLKKLKEDPNYLKGDGDADENTEGVTYDEADAAEQAEVADAEPEEEKLAPYTVAKGKAITTLRGIKSDGDEIKADDLPGGKKALDGFVKSKHVVKN